jgi:hypothetical protein
MSDSSLTVKNLDHLGIVAGLVDELGLVLSGAEKS